MSKTKFKYFFSIITLALCVNFLLFTTGSIYLNQNIVNVNQTQNGPQKRSYSSAHNIQIKLQSENDEKDEDIEEEIEEEHNFKHAFNKNFFNTFHKTIVLKKCLSKKSFSKPNFYNSLNELYIAFRVFRL